MKKIIFVYGAIAGCIVIGSILLGFAAQDKLAVFTTQWFGYLVMFVALSLIFVGVKRYRDIELGGVITFGKAVVPGLGIAVVAGVCYVIGWEMYLAATDYAFIDLYTQGVIDAKRASGVTGEELEQAIASMEQLKTQYANPLFRLPMTFLEIFPVGLLIALVSAALLRNPRVLPAQA
jgi:Protein of unknown function (DUF4199)